VLGREKLIIICEGRSENLKQKEKRIKLLKGGKI